MRKSGGVQGAEAGDGDARLVAGIGRGDRHAFQELYRAYFPRLARFLGRMTRNAPLMEEVINDTMLVVWQKALTYDGSSKVSTWIFGIAYRQALKALRGVDEPVEFTVEPPGGPEHEPEYAVVGKQLQQGISVALAALPLEQRMVVSLTYFHDMAYQEIADTMGCPVNTVKTRMFHARQRLKAMLSPHMESTK